MKKNTKYSIIAILYFIAMFFVIAAFNGCKPSLETCNRLYPPQINDSIAYVEKLDTAFFILPSDTTILRVPIPCPDFIASTNTGKKDVKVIIKDHYLIVSSVSKEDSFKIYTLLKNRYKTNTVIKKVVEVKKEAPKWSWYSLIINIALIASIILWIKLKK